MKADPQQAGDDRQRLARALRDLRKASGLSGDRLARRCNVSQSKISRIENGRTLPSVVDVERILLALSVDKSTRDELLNLARVANTEFRDIRASVRRGLHHRQRELAALEESATQLRYFLPSLVTGLLQTPEYMRAAMDTPVEPARGDTSRAIALRVERQRVLQDATKRFEFLLTEQAVRWRLCAAPVMALQVDRLVSLSRLPNVRIGLLPLSGELGVGPMNTFTVYDRNLVTVETFTGQMVLRDPKDIQHHLDLFRHFSTHALWGEEARSVLGDVLAEFMRPPE
ncbi:helix-turn-helix domain-containing protein [Actinomadura rupiterrae]|uniref:helix-turn-helix domain-containing protein n=1 Tax=Actinomadura rupiterrae TaxID=559627 RepID=UPI0020A48E6C|nr:helix-turn-helix transcriptional regulator [Actinomadura rupiterrae]MCP2334811.1 transcriptional regulator with XRE-family HTH domain [Actinomadura rupiterrae]